MSFSTTVEARCRAESSRALPIGCATERELVRRIGRRRGPETANIGIKATRRRCVAVWRVEGTVARRSCFEKVLRALLREQGFFLSWLSERLKNADLVPQLNRAMRQEEWQDGTVLKRLLVGNDVERLFREYRDSFSSDRSPSTEQPPAPVPTHVAPP